MKKPNHQNRAMDGRDDDIVIKDKSGKVVFDSRKKRQSEKKKRQKQDSTGQ